MYGCNVCGGRMIGDGIHSPLRCENYELHDGVEADSGPWYCEVSSEKWTKGPWFIEVGRDEDNDGYIYVCHRGTECNETTVVNFEEPTDEDAANAHLIAAAPDMYEALLKCVAADPTIVTNRPGWMDYVASIEGARAALKKARGES